MSPYRCALPQLDADLFLADGGLETTLVFHERLDLPCFAAFPLLAHAEGRATLRRYYERYVRIAHERGTGIVLETPTWRANADWGARLGFDAEALARVNRDAVAFVDGIRRAHERPGTPIVVSGNLGPRGDGYRAEGAIGAQAAQRYHAAQIAAFAGTAADMVAAFTMNHADEAIGIARAAREHGMPVAISFTLETDGRLPSGEPLPDAIARTDDATHGYAAYYMINCAHPTHFAGAIDPDAAWALRIRGVRANASRRSHVELDDAADLDEGDPAELGAQYAALRARLPRLAVVGGCCGTDHRHVAAIGAAMSHASP